MFVLAQLSLAEGNSVVASFVAQRPEIDGELTPRSLLARHWDTRQAAYDFMHRHYGARSDMQVIPATRILIRLAAWKKRKQMTKRSKTQSPRAQGTQPVSAKRARSARRR
jgi:hypothetical protein